MSHGGPLHPQWVDGRSLHPLYTLYRGMLARCYNPGHNGYEYYGARGIKVCQRWRDDFWSFVSDVGPRPEGRSLDRIDGDGNYSPDNCRWATSVEQNANTRPRRMRTHCLRGHEFTPLNTYRRADGRRACVTCQRERERKWRSASTTLKEKS